MTNEKTAATFHPDTPRPARARFYMTSRGWGWTLEAAGNHEPLCQSSGAALGSQRVAVRNFELSTGSLVEKTHYRAATRLIFHDDATPEAQVIEVTGLMEGPLRANQASAADAVEDAADNGVS